MNDRFLDVRGLACPLPVLRAAKILRTLAAGQQLVVVATDPAAPADFTQYCRERGYALRHEPGPDGEHRLTVTVPGTPPWPADDSGTDSS